MFVCPDRRTLPGGSSSRRTVIEYQHTPIEPDIVTQAEVHAVQIELAGQHTRGHSAVDWWNRSGAAPNVNLVLEMDRERLWALMEMMVV